LSNWLPKQEQILSNLIEAAEILCFRRHASTTLGMLVQALPSRVWKVPIDAILAQLANID
jgi:hypothetical protein